MKWLLILFLLASPAYGKVISTATHPNSGEVMALTDEQGHCPDTTLGPAREVIYKDARDGEQQLGCYLVDAENSTVVIIFKQGTYAGRPIHIPLRMFRPEL